MAQIHCTVDDVLKEEAIRNLKREGLSLKAFISSCLKAYNEGKIALGIETKDPDTLWTEENKKAYEEAIEDLKNGEAVDGKNFLQNLIAQK